MATATKPRHEVAEGWIRARYGHSLPGRINHSLATPPEFLFHGTAPQTVAIVGTEGLRPRQRQFVHLSADQETALAVGKRKASAPTVLTVAALRAASAGVRFYEGSEKVWLADEVPPEFLSW